jgi:hypothetical protein
MNPPTKSDLAALRSLCSTQEWDALSLNTRFIAASGVSLEEMERIASALLGRKISVSQPSLRNSGDETL